MGLRFGVMRVCCVLVWSIQSACAEMRDANTEMCRNLFESTTEPERLAELHRFSFAWDGKNRLFTAVGPLSSLNLEGKTQPYSENSRSTESIKFISDEDGKTYAAPLNELDHILGRSVQRALMLTRLDFAVRARLAKEYSKKFSKGAGVLRSMEAVEKQFQRNACQPDSLVRFALRDFVFHDFSSRDRLESAEAKYLRYMEALASGSFLRFLEDVDRYLPTSPDSIGLLLKPLQLASTKWHMIDFGGDCRNLVRSSLSICRGEITASKIFRAMPHAEDTRALGGVISVDNIVDIMKDMNTQQRHEQLMKDNEANRKESEANRKLSAAIAFNTAIKALAQNRKEAARLQSKIERLNNSSPKGPPYADAASAAKGELSIVETEGRGLADSADQIAYYGGMTPTSAQSHLISQGREPVTETGKAAEQQVHITIGAASRYWDDAQSPGPDPPNPTPFPPENRNSKPSQPEHSADSPAGANSSGQENKIPTEPHQKTGGSSHDDTKSNTAHDTVPPALREPPPQIPPFLREPEPPAPESPPMRPIDTHMPPDEDRFVRIEWPTALARLNGALTQCGVKRSHTFQELRRIRYDKEACNYDSLISDLNSADENFIENDNRFEFEMALKKRRDRYLNTIGVQDCGMADASIDCAEFDRKVVQKIFDGGPEEFEALFSDENARSPNAFGSAYRSELDTVLVDLLQRRWGE